MSFWYCKSTKQSKSSCPNSVGRFSALQSRCCSNANKGMLQHRISRFPTLERGKGFAKFTRRPFRRILASRDSDGCKPSRSLQFLRTTHNRHGSKRQEVDVWPQFTLEPKQNKKFLIGNCPCERIKRPAFCKNEFPSNCINH
jgi:hypothetical protein